MGHIFDRIYRIAKSYRKDSDAPRGHYSIENDNDELRRIISELRSEGPDNSARSKGAAAEEAFSRMDENSAYQILGIEAHADAEAIRSAYRKRLNEYHPDRVENLGEEIKTLAKNKTRQIIEAYNFLKKTKGL
ncbi:MAG: J domain-containing protein [Candidatus Kapaibacterium sp.]